MSKLYNILHKIYLEVYQFLNWLSIYNFLNITNLAEAQFVTVALSYCEMSISVFKVVHHHTPYLELKSKHWIGKLGFFHLTEDDVVLSSVSDSDYNKYSGYKKKEFKDELIKMIKKARK